MKRAASILSAILFTAAIGGCESDRNANDRTAYDDTGSSGLRSDRSYARSQSDNGQSAADTQRTDSRRAAREPRGSARRFCFPI